MLITIVVPFWTVSLLIFFQLHVIKGLFKVVLCYLDPPINSVSPTTSESQGKLEQLL